MVCRSGRRTLLLRVLSTFHSGLASVSDRRLVEPRRCSGQSPAGGADEMSRPSAETGNVSSRGSGARRTEAKPRSRVLIQARRNL